MAAHVVTAIKTPRWLIAVLLGMVVMSFTAVADGRELEWEVVVHDVVQSGGEEEPPDHSLRQLVSPREIAEFGGVEDHVFVGELGLPSRGTGAAPACRPADYTNGCGAATVGDGCDP